MISGADQRSTNGDSWRPAEAKQLHLSEIDQKDWHHYDLEIQSVLSLGEDSLADSKSYRSRERHDSIRVVRREDRETAPVPVPAPKILRAMPEKQLDAAAIAGLREDDLEEYELEIRLGDGADAPQLSIVPRELSFDNDRALRRLLQSLRRCRAALRTAEEALEFDRQWALTAESNAFRNDLVVLRKIAWRLKNHLRYLQTAPDYFHEFVEDVHTVAERQSADLKQMPQSERHSRFGSHILLSFAVDLLGRRTYEAAIFSSANCHVLATPPKMQSFVQILCIAALIAANSVLIFLSASVGRTKSANWLYTWSTAFATAVILDVVLLELVETLWTRLVVPELCRGSVQAVRDILERCVCGLQEDNLRSISNAGERREGTVCDQLFVANKLAVACPASAESKMVLAHSITLPGLLREHWMPSGATTFAAEGQTLMGRVKNEATDWLKFFASLPAVAQRTVIVGVLLALVWGISEGSESKAMRYQNFWIYGVVVLCALLAVVLGHLLERYGSPIQYVRKLRSARKVRDVPKSPNHVLKLSRNERVEPAPLSSADIEAPLRSDSVVEYHLSSDEASEVADVDREASDNEPEADELSAGEAFSELGDSLAEDDASVFAEEPSVVTADTGSVLVSTPYRTYSVPKRFVPKHMDIRQFLEASADRNSDDDDATAASMEALYSHVTANKSAIRKSLSIMSVGSDEESRARMHEISDSSEDDASTDSVGI